MYYTSHCRRGRIDGGAVLNEEAQFTLRTHTFSMQHHIDEGRYFGHNSTCIHTTTEAKTRNLAWHHDRCYQKPNPNKIKKEVTSIVMKNNPPKTPTDRCCENTALYLATTSPNPQPCGTERSVPATKLCLLHIQCKDETVSRNKTGKKKRAIFLTPEMTCYFSSTRVRSVIRKSVAHRLVFFAQGSDAVAIDNSTRYRHL